MAIQIDEFVQLVVADKMGSNIEARIDEPRFDLCRHDL
jgi:hypothetical protein